MYFFLLLCFLFCGYVWVDSHVLHYFYGGIFSIFWGLATSSMDVIILLFVVSSLHSMLIILCVMLCVMSLIPVSIYKFSLGVDVGTINTRFIMLSSILLIVGIPTRFFSVFVFRGLFAMS